MKSHEEILELEKVLLKLENLHASFDYLRISIASPKRIKSWAERILPSGEIVSEVINPKFMVFFVKKFLDQLKTGNVNVANTMDLF